MSVHVVKTSCRVADLLAKKSAGEELTEEQLQQLVTSIATDQIDQVQLGAFLMAVYVRGLTSVETVALTSAMMHSGSILSWPSDWTLGDKHSTGGVGDKVSIPLTPALAACGLKVPMISGRGLMHTGGTLDKMESIPGLQVLLPAAALTEALEEVGCVIAGQTATLVPADKKMYAARDVTGTVASTPLIVSSILSKKGAESLNALVIDVKFGSGSFMKTREEATNLARSLVRTMGAMGVTTTGLITTMDYPIGRTIGNSLEVQESLECLKGVGPPDLLELVLELGGELLASAGLADSAADGSSKVMTSLNDGSAMETFKKMIMKQGVVESVADCLCSAATGSIPSCLPRAECTTPIAATRGGVIVSMSALPLAEVSLALGAGRSKAEDPIHHEVGLRLEKVVGEAVDKDEVWVTVHHLPGTLSEELVQKIQDALDIEPTATPFDTPKRVVEKVSLPF